ncbi:MAG: hypothetical protein P9L99_10025 [Candidatus Lernaella stagnicola]|nr:hypothetical protein [Candidatus Lernaella stagnicola]
MRAQSTLLAVILVAALAIAAQAEYGGWTSLYSISDHNQGLIDVSAPDQDTVFAVGAASEDSSTFDLIYRTLDGGATWESVYEMSLNLAPENFCEFLRLIEARSSVEMVTPEFGLFGGSGVDLECIERFGHTIEEQFACILVCADTLQPQLWLTEDSGETFHDADIPPDDSYGTIQDVVMVDDLVGYAAGLNSYFIKTTDGGFTWSTMPALYAPRLYVNRMQWLDENEGWLAIGQWEEEPEKAEPLRGRALIARQLHRMRMSSDPLYRREHWAKSDEKTYISGSILHTTDGGMTWEVLKQSTAEGYSWVFFVDRDTGFIVGDETVVGGFISKFYKTENGGDSWEPYLQNFPTEMPGIAGEWAPEGVSFVNPGFGMVWGYAAKTLAYAPALFYTVDGGDNWTLDEHALTFDGGQYALAWVDNTTVYSVGMHVNLLKYEGTNSGPVADAGADVVTTVGEPVTLDGSGSSDVDGDGLFYTWTQTAGVAMQLDDPAAAQPAVVGEQEGEGIFALVVNDGMVDSDADQVTVTVNPAVDDDDEAADDDTIDDDDDDDDTDGELPPGDDDDDDDSSGGICG